MKLIIAKTIYFAALGMLVLLGLSLATLFLISLAPVFWAILGILIACIPLGMAIGWAEKTIDKELAYKASGKKLGGK